MEQKRKEYILRESIWRCGTVHPASDVRRGEGTTLLLNNQGFQCCIGQFLEQDGVFRDLLLDKSWPRELPQIRVPEDSLWAETGEGYYGQPFFCNTDLTERLASINDGTSSVADKVEAIRKELEKHGVSLKFIPRSEEVL